VRQALAIQAQMKKLQKYVLFTALKALVPAFAALVLLMVVGVCMQLLREGLDIVRLSPLLPPVFAYCVPVVLPSAFLTAVIMAFGRLSADNELMAVRAAGVHLFSVVYPVLGAAAVLSLVAAFFQFEAVPRARASIKALEYRALRQILLDKVALSGRRQFSFGRAFIQYDDFRDGQMIGLVALEVEGHKPPTIITAASCTIRPDPEHDERVVFEMRDCVLTSFEREEYGAPRTVTGVRYTYFVKVAPKIEEIRTHRKHLPLLPLLRERKRLRNSVGRRPAFRNPQAETADERNQRDRLDVRIRRLDGTLQDRQGKYRKYADQLPRQHEQVIEANRDLIRDAQQQLEDLQQQQAECMKQLDAMHDSDADLARLVELQRTQGRLLAKIEATKTQIQELRAKTVEAEAAIEGAAAKAAELRGDVAELEQHRQVLLRQRRELTQTIRSAQDQEDLTSIVIRIHKRLAQAVSVFVFVLVGIPLGIVASRRSVMVAFGISFAIVLMVFYPFLILGQIAAEAGSVPAFPGMWVGNGLTFLIGLALMARVMSR
jgi:lipopolysaccharide export LptBFGC system permease protein LptF